MLVQADAECSDSASVWPFHRSLWFVWCLFWSAWSRNGSGLTDPRILMREVLVCIVLFCLNACRCIMSLRVWLIRSKEAKHFSLGNYRIDIHCDKVQGLYCLHTKHPIVWHSHIDKENLQMNPVGVVQKQYLTSKPETEQDYLHYALIGHERHNTRTFLAW